MENSLVEFDPDELTVPCERCGEPIRHRSFRLTPKLCEMCRTNDSFRFLADGEDGTVRLGNALAAALQPGDVVALNGPLGAGKTRLVRAVAAALGFADQMVSSPTFVLIHEYDGRVPLYHVDAYRLRDSDEFLSIGGDEVLAGDRACLIEWADRIGDLLPRDHLRIDITAVGQTRREFILSANGQRSGALLNAIRAELAEQEP